MPLPVCLYYLICTSYHILNPSLLGARTGPPDTGPKTRGAPGMLLSSSCR